MMLFFVFGIFWTVYYNGKIKGQILLADAICKEAGYKEYAYDIAGERMFSGGQDLNKLGGGGLGCRTESNGIRWLKVIYNKTEALDYLIYMKEKGGST